MSEKHAGHLPQPHHAHAKRLIAAGLFITLGFSAICWLVMWEVGRRDYEQARQAADNVVSAIVADISRQLDTYDLSLQAVVDGLKMPEISTVSAKVRDVILFDRAATAKDMGAILVLDANGDVSIDSRAVAPPSINHADRDYFTAHVTNAHVGRYISRPWVNASGDHFIAISRRITDNDGSFLGVVVGTLRLSYFNGLFRRVTMDAGDVISLAREDGTMIMRLPYDPKLIGRNFGQSRVFKTFLSDISGAFEDVAITDGEPRLYVFKHVEDAPLIVSNGLSIRNIYKHWRHEAWLVGTVLVTLCATNVGLVVFLARTLKRRSEAEHQLAIQAVTDSLTRLSNRRLFDQFLNREWARAQREGHPLALLMIDTDHFKHFNDQHGHQLGDEALAAIADCIARAARRASDCCARYGGEEFAVIVPGDTTEEAMQLAEAIRANVMALRAQQQLDDVICSPTVSIGVASVYPQAGLSVTDLVRSADAALYEAKDAGRDRCVASPSPPLSQQNKKVA
jgi:diguanylate cyclase (GGDEF)-like protein